MYYLIKGEIIDYTKHYQILVSTSALVKNINPIEDEGGGGGKKAPSPTSFSPITSTNVGIRPQKCLTFSFNSFDKLV